jgi:hypothetical protein
MVSFQSRANQNYNLEEDTFDENIHNMVSVVLTHL